MRGFLRITATVVALTAYAGTAGAGVLAIDEFDYVGALTDNSWVAHSGAGNKVIMADGSVATLEQSSGSGEDVNLSFPAQMATDKTYAAFTLNLPAADNADIVNVDGDGLYFFHLKDSGFSFRARTGVVAPSGGGDYGLAINADSSGLGGGATWASDLTFDTDYRVVVSWDAGTGESQLWLDPSSEGDTSISHTGTSTGTLIDSVALRQGSDYTGGQLIDNVIAGDTFGDVLDKPSSLSINEIRIDQSGTDNDEYFELCCGPDDSLDGLTYLVIGDGDGGSGTIEAVIDLAGTVCPADGLFLGAEATFTLNGAIPDLIGILDFENSDNVTHLLVSDFSGLENDDVDADDDGVMDNEPWSEIIDCIGLVETVGSGDLIYCDTTIGPDGTFVPAHVYRCTDCTGDWVIGVFDPLDFDTPGEPNFCDPTGACCSPEGECTEVAEADCLDPDVYQGDDTTCAETECVAVPGACCLVGECSELTFQECADVQGSFEGSGTFCMDVDCSVPCSTVAEVRAMEDDLVVNLCGVTITSTVDLVSGGVKNFQMQDDTGAITVFSGDEDIDALLFVAGRGDKIDLVATTNSFCGLSEVSEPFAITLVEPGAGAKDTIKITIEDLQDFSPTAEALESKVVELADLTFVDGDCVTLFEGGTNYTVTSGGFELTVRIADDGDGGIDLIGTPIPGGGVVITGIVGQFDCDDPADSGYQLFPRSLKDIRRSQCEGDANGSGDVDPLDSGHVLARFGCTVGVGDAGCDAADQNLSCDVDPLDVGFVMARFGNQCD